MKKTYYKKNEYDEDGNKVYSGRNAIRCLIDISNREYIHLNGIDKRLGAINLLLCWKFRAI